MITIKAVEPKIVYPTKFIPGDIAISTTYIRFLDDTTHVQGQEILVTKENQSYFNVCHADYSKKV